MSHRVDLSLGIWKFEDITHDEITSMLSVVPSRKFIRGEKINPNFYPIAKENGWSIDADEYGTGTFETQLRSLLEFIERNSITFKNFGEKYYLELGCAIFLECDSDESTPWVHFDKSTQKIFAAYNIEVDFDLYVTEHDNA